MNILFQKLKDMGIEVPEVKPPVANYLIYNLVDNIAFISGQLPKLDECTKGKLNQNLSETEFLKANEQIFANFLAVVNHINSEIENTNKKVTKIHTLSAFVPAELTEENYPIFTKLIELYGLKVKSFVYQEDIVPTLKVELDENNQEDNITTQKAEIKIVKVKELPFNVPVEIDFQVEIN